MNIVPKLIIENPELLLYMDGKLHITVLGGIKLTGFDLLKAERKIALQYLKAPGLLGKTRQAISASGIVGEEVNNLVYTSRLFLVYMAHLHL